LESLAINQTTFYITKAGFSFYTQIGKSFAEHWIKPYQSTLPPHKEVLILTTSPSGARTKKSDDIHLVGYLRLVKTAS